jgi:hypothetical protein
MMSDPMLVTTRTALHAVAELVLAGPQFRESGTIRLHVTPDGFATVAAPDIRVAGGELVAAGQRTTITGATARSLGGAAGVDVGAPEGLYADGSGAAPDDPLILNPPSLRRIIDAFTTGAAALRVLIPDPEPVLWPEHFDLGSRVDDVNLGISPGDNFIPEPYAYVGVDPVPDDPYWNAPFGAARPMSTFVGVDDLAAFFGDARRHRTHAPR